MAKAVRWDLIADPRGFNRGFKDAGRTADNFGRGLRKTASLIGGAFAAVQVAGFLKDAIAEAREAAKVTRQTNAVIKATGGVANVSAKDVDRLATALSNKVGVDDEAIAAGQNMLLTFKGVRNEVGKGNDIFNQATKVALDMTAALNQGEVTQSGLEKSTIRLGKALNDPIKGVTALTKVGVTFTDSQKEQIKTLVESGDTMAAQKIILKELGSEFGGAAEAATDPWQRLQVTFKNVQETIGTALLPALNNAADFIVDNLIPAAEKWWKVHGPQFREAFAKAAETAKDIWQVIDKEVIPVLQELATRTLASVKEGLDQMAKAWRDNKVAIVDLGASLKDLKPVWDVISFLIDKLATDEIPNFIKQVGFLARVWRAAGNVIVNMNKFIAVTFIEAIRTIVRGAATIAEKLHLPFAKGLRAADKELAGFRDKFNDKMDQLKNEDVVVKLRSTFTPPKGFSMHSIVGAQEGMRIPGYGGGDRVPIMAEAGEAVVPKHLAATSGFRGWAGAHGIPGFAFGGVVPSLRSFSPAGMSVTQEGIDARVAAKVDAGIERNFKLLVGMPGIQRALSWARGEAGKPYIWGGVGPAGYDCSGFMSAIANVVMGRSPHQRLFATGSFPASGWVPGYSPLGFSIGSRRGHPGHMAGNLGGVAVESRGSRGVVVGGGARGAQSSLFGGNIWHLTGTSGAPGGKERLLGFDRGGWLPPGLSMAYNGTGRPERVTPAGKGGGDIHVHLHGDVYGDQAALVAKIRAGIRDAQRREAVPAGQQLR